VIPDRKRLIPTLPSFGIFRRAALKSVAACVLLATLLWQFTAPILANTGCGLLLPHDHILTGEANREDLERHLEAEEDCALGKPDVPDEQAVKLQGRKGRIVNVVPVGISEIIHSLSLDQVTAHLPGEIASPDFRQLYIRLIPIHLFDHSAIIIPPIPPPKD
jgi:hypothetical protein